MRIAFILLAIITLSVEAQAVKLDLDNPNGIAALYSVGSGIAEDQTFVVCTKGKPGRKPGARVGAFGAVTTC